MIPHVSIQTLVEEVYENSSTPQAASIVDAVIDSVPENQLRAYLKSTLKTGSIYTMLAKIRKQSMHISEGQTDPTPAEIAMQNAGKNEDAKLAFKKLMRSPIPTKDGGYIYLEDATVEDIMYQSSNRRERAASMVTEAKYWESIAKQMEKHNVSRVGDLPPTVSAALFNR